jgi:arylsulfatase A-like enzyme
VCHSSLHTVAGPAAWRRRPTRAPTPLRGFHRTTFTDGREVDRPIAGLLADLKSRGMLDDTLVVWGGEFGRTPTGQGGDGRDHNPHGFTGWLAGAGLKPGTSFGQTDDYGFDAAQDKVHVHDLHATILYLLGIDHERLTYRYAGRDFRLTDVEGKVVRQILA